MRIVDSHAHLNFSQFSQDLAAVLVNATNAGVVGMVNIGTDLLTSQESVALAESRPNIWATVGVHPHDVTGLDESWEELSALAANPRVVAIGEIGLDYFRNLSPIDAQKSAFIRQLTLAIAVDKPVVLHCRDAYADLLDIVRDTYLPARPVNPGILHSFAGGVVEARQFTELGFLLGVNNLITYPKNEGIREAVRLIPLESLVVETDCPFLPPQSLRGSRCEPAHTVSVVEAIAEIKNLSPEEVATVTTKNLETLLNVQWP